MRKKMIKQKLCGIACIGITVFSGVLFHDVTIGGLFVPLGLYLIVTRDYWLND